jgi:hypothetical protein
MPNASTNSARRSSPRAFATRQSVAGIFFGIALCWCASTVDAGAAEASVAISFSPESARMIRDWRRAHGLPQGPEADDAQTSNIRREAMASALRLSGVEHVAAENLDVATTHIGSHWQVVIRSRDDSGRGEWIVDVGDSALRSAL